MRNALRITAAAILSLMPLSAQTQQAQQAPKTDIPKLVENIDVRVINVDVVVTDKKGNIVTGLKKDDFEIFENGIPKPISNFYGVEGGKANPVEGEPEAPPQPTTTQAPVRQEIPDNMKRRIIFYIDNLSMAPFNRNRVFQNMKEFAKSTMRPGDEAMIATFNRSMKVRTPFTRDPGQIQTTLDIIAGESALGTSMVSERKDVEGRIRDTSDYDEALASARSYASSVEHDLRQSAESINGLMTTLAGVEGKKILVLASEGFPMQPGREIFQYIDELANEKGWRFSGTILEGMSFDSTTLIQSIARTANANGITMYTIHAAGLSAGDTMSAENAQPVSNTVSQAIITNTTDSMRLMADMTGGLASIQTNNFGQAFKNIQRDLDTYYSLGYRASTERIDRQRQLQVRVKRKDLIARARQTFVEKSTFAEMNDKVVANLLYRTKQNDLKILVRTGTPVAADEDLYKVPVEIQIPMDSLTLLPQGDTEYVGGFDVYVAVANKDGDMSDVSRKSHSLRVPTPDMARAKGKYYAYSLDLLMEKGLNKISIGVVDNISNVSGFAREQVIAQDLR
ncbi:MAG TPA: VWA domain-containing protein [Thermoanaerobaculia bacterium]|nr:VWA domain-containing protein [Thermoanaerobaculia bacterium]